MKAFVMLALAGSLLMVFVPAAHASPSTGGCAQYPTSSVQVAACNDDEGARCVLVFDGGSHVFACVPYESLLQAPPPEVHVG